MKGQKRKRQSKASPKPKRHKSQRKEGEEPHYHDNQPDVDELDGYGGSSDELPVDTGGAEEEEEEEGGGEGKEEVGGASGEKAGGCGGKGRPKIAGLYRPPTHEELQQLKETENLFNSNLMKLQITELLSEVRPPQKASLGQQLEQLLHSLRSTLTALPHTEQVDLCAALSLLPPKVKYPLPLDPSNLKGKFQFRPPKTVKVVGSYLLGTMTKPDLNIDLVLQLPQECLQAKDHLNYRYFHKRALYLCMVASHLKRKKRKLGLQSVKFSLSSGNPLLPIVVVSPEGKGLSKYNVRLHTAIPESYFKATKLGPDRNNVRRNILPDLTDQPDLSDKSSDEHVATLPVTPHYNSTLLREMGALERHLTEVFSAVQECPAMGDTIALCKAWLRQRTLDQGYGGFTGFHCAMLMVLLLQQKKLNRLMSSYQILRILFQYLATTDLTKDGVTMAKADPTLPSLASFHSSFDVVFLDSSGYLNLCGSVSRERFLWLQHEAQLSMAFLDDAAVSGFEALFMRPVDFVQKFDALCHITPASVLESSLTDPAVREAVLLDGLAWPLPLLLKRVLPILQRGLGQRVKLVVTKPFTSPEWLPSKAPSSLCTSHVTLGLLWDTDCAFRILDMGPPADGSEAAVFRSFWGQRSELRRFQDGSINEAVVWEGKDVAQRRTVYHQVIQHLLQRHASIPPECVTSPISALGSLLTLPAYSDVARGPEDESSDPAPPPSTGEEVALTVLEVFSELSRELRQLKDLPLAITSLQGASPAFRHTEVFPPLPWNGKLSSKLQAAPADDCQSDCWYPSCDMATPPYVPALEIVCQLESSGKWPDEVEAIRGIKTAFYVHLTRALQEQEGVLASPTPHFLDVLKSGYVFRLRIHHHRELTLLKEAVATATDHEARAEYQQLERSLVSLPLLTSTLHGLHQQFPAFGAGARLCKRWSSAHLLSNHLTEEATELMVARLFLCPAPHTPPGSPVCVLLRFLALLANHDWASEPLIVNLNQELSPADISDITSRFSSSPRSHLPSLFIATPHDRNSSHWTTPTPSAPVFARIQLLAKESLTLLSQQLLTQDPAELDFKQIFRTPLKDYNILIHLHKRHLPLSEQGVDTMATGSAHRSHPLKHRHYSHMPVIDFNPVEKYLSELEAAFSEFALFFHDKYGGTFIAVAWKPHAFIAQPFKVSHAHCRIPAERSRKGSKKHKTATSTAAFVPDVGAIIADFQLMGQGLVKSVEELSSPPSAL